MPRANLKIMFQRDLRKKGITWTRQHVHRKVKRKEFPPPDGKTSDTPSAPNWWWEHTIDKYLRQRAAAMRDRRAFSSSQSNQEQPFSRAVTGAGSENER